MPEKAREKRRRRGAGFHSAAGLIRYYEAEEDSALKIDPKVVIALCIISGIAIEIIKCLWPY